MSLHLGIDVGAVSANLALLDEGGAVVHALYLRTHGQPIPALQRGLRQLAESGHAQADVTSACATGSGRQLAGAVVGAALVKNEITAHYVGASHVVPEVRTVFEIGGQDSKVIAVEDGLFTDFAMNTICAAGTGAFLDQQAERLGIPIERFGELAQRAKSPVPIGGRCTVFAESDMVHKQQRGASTEDLVAGLCDAIVGNYLTNVCRGVRIEPPVVFQGGVAANLGVRDAFERALGYAVMVPEHQAVMGAVGAALLAREEAGRGKARPPLLPLAAAQVPFEALSFDCDECDNACEVTVLFRDGRPVASWGSRCGRWTEGLAQAAERAGRATTGLPARAQEVGHPCPEMPGARTCVQAPDGR
ncbi:MAG: acyl-CoA dehydratase activase [Armatimonadota bacterium]